MANRFGISPARSASIVLTASVLACSCSGNEASVGAGGSPTAGGMTTAGAGAGSSAGGGSGNAGLSGAAGSSASSGGSGTPSSGGTTTGGASNPSGGTTTGGNTGGGTTTGGLSASGGTTTGGLDATGGVAGNSGGASPKGGGANAGGPALGGSSGSGGTATAGAGGGGGATGGSGGAGGAASPPFVCNEVVGGKLTYEWFTAGFENGVDNTRWQIRWKDDAFVQEWAKPDSPFWNAPIESACARNTTGPDRIVYMVFSWSVKSQADFRTYTTQTVNNFKAKYPNLRRIDLVNQIRGPNNMLCPTPPAANETIVVSQELQAAMTEVAAAFPTLVFIAPPFEARSCADFQGGGPHLTSAGNMAGARLIAEHFAQTQ